MYNLSANRAEDELSKTFDCNETMDIDKVIRIITYWLNPDDVFDYATLEKWAEENGFSKTE